MRTLAVAATFALFVHVAHADSTPQNQVEANKLYQEGNQLVAQESYAAAVEKYKAALALWNEPKIRFNLATAEVQLDRLLEAADDLEAVMRVGPSHFTPEQWNNALASQKLLRGRVGTIDVRCTQSGTSLTLDGKPWLSCPATATKRVLAGSHAVIGEGKGYVTASQRVFVTGGEVAHATIALVSLDDAVDVTYAHPRWVSWTLVGSGAAIGLGGLAVWLSARSELDSFSQQLTGTCPSGCNLSSQPSLESQLDDARLRNKVAVGMWVVGGVAVASGVVYAILNRPTRVLQNVEVAPSPSGGATATIRGTF